MEKNAKTDIVNSAQYYLDGAAVIAELASSSINIYGIRGIETDHPMVDFEFQWMLHGKVIKWTKMSMPLATLELVGHNPHTYRLQQTDEENGAFERAYAYVLSRVNRYMYDYLKLSGEEGAKELFDGGDMEVTQDGLRQDTPVTRIFNLTIGEIKTAVHYRAILKLVQDIRSELED